MKNTLMPEHPNPFPDGREWRAWMIRAIDGDTIAVKIDLGFRASVEIDIRIMDYDSPEVVGADRAAGEAARDFLATTVPPATPLLIYTYRMRRSFNRYVAMVAFWNGSEWQDVTRTMIDAGHGKPSE